MPPSATAFNLNEFNSKVETYWKSVNILFAEDGVFLQLPLNWTLIDEASIDFLCFLTEQQGISCSVPEVLKYIRNGLKTIRLSDSSAPKTRREDGFIFVTPDKMQSFLILTPADENGAKLSLAALWGRIKKFGIKAGVDEEAMKCALRDGEYFKPVLIASGKEPVKGVDTFHEYLFSRFKTALPIARGDDSKIDYKNLDLIESVTKGQLLVRKHPATKGDGGINVFGEIIAPLPGKDIPSPRGKNCELSEDGLELFSQLDGQVEFVNKNVVVSNVLTINKGVDLSTGNIDFIGNVKVLGNVISDMTITATGSIEVLGAVEAATLIAGGSIILRAGMQGNGVGFLKSGGSIVAVFLERIRVECQGSVTADTLLHCDIKCNGRVVCRGKRGIIIGGNISARTSVTANIIGNVANMPTKIEAGLSPGSRQRGLEVEKEILHCQEELKKCEKVLKTLPSYNMEPAKRVALTMQMKETQKKTQGDLMALTLELGEIVEGMETATDGKIHIKDTIYPGTTIGVGAANSLIKSRIQYATFKLINGQVSFGVYEGNE